MTLQFLSQAREMRSALVKGLYCAVCAVFVGVLSTEEALLQPLVSVGGSFGSRDMISIPRGGPLGERATKTETSYFQSQMHFDDSVESIADSDLKDGELQKMLTSPLYVQKA